MSLRRLGRLADGSDDHDERRSRLKRKRRQLNDHPLGKCGGRTDVCRPEQHYAVAARETTSKPEGAALATLSELLVQPMLDGMHPIDSW
jgi:hypothetical protein